MDKVLGYKVPAEILDQVRIGSLVIVPLLRRLELGIVKDLEAPRDYPLSKLKYISGLDTIFSTQLFCFEYGQKLSCI